MMSDPSGRRLFRTKSVSGGSPTGMRSVESWRIYWAGLPCFCTHKELGGLSS
jgi:hypothetical protein